MKPARELTGRHVLFTALAAFGVIIAANLTMVLLATSSFPGLVDKNSYVASQNFNRNAERLRRLGWTSAVDYSQGRLAVRVTQADGGPRLDLSVTATVGRPADARSDQLVALAWDGVAYAAPLTLGPGVWRVAVAAADAEGDTFETTARLELLGPGAPAGSAR